MMYYGMLNYGDAIFVGVLVGMDVFRNGFWLEVERL